MARRREFSVSLVATAILIAATTLTVATSETADWRHLGVLGLLTVLALGSETLSFEVRGLRLSGSFLSIVLAMALLGPAPAVALGVASVIVDVALGRRWVDRVV